MLTTDFVAFRTLVFGSITMRSQMEHALHSEDAERAEGAKIRGENLLQWVEEQNLLGSFTPNERLSWDEPLGGWTQETAFESFWRLEAMKGLAWTIGHLPEMPSYYAVGDVMQYYGLIPFWSPIEHFLSQAQLLSEEVLRAEREKAEFLNWRMRTELLRLQNMVPPDGDTYEAVVARALEGDDVTEMGVEHDGVDILVDGTRFCDLVTEEIGDMMSICAERHRVLEWICSNDEDWDNARADT